jgi:CRISPR system Cascade subunit CasE
MQVKDLSPMFHALAPGRRVRYRIAANPAKRKRLPLEEKKKRGPIQALTGPEADQWWIRRAANAGLEVHTLLPTPLPALRSRVNGKTGMRHHLTNYDGTATITDPDALNQAVVAGIGRGKPYGAGLLSLAPAGTT